MGRSALHRSAWVVALMLVSACGGPPLSPDPTSPPSPAASASPEAASPPPAPIGEPTFKVKHRSTSLGGSVVPVLIYDRTGMMKAARRAKERDLSPVIKSNVQPRIGADPSIRRDLRVLFYGGPCDSEYTVEVTLNAAGGYHFDVRQAPFVSLDCDTPAIERGVVLKFKSPVDPSIATGTFVSAAH